MSRTTAISESTTVGTTPFQPNRRQLEDFQTLKSMSPDRAGDTVFRWLLSDDRDRVELATVIIVGSGAPAVPLLIGEAMRPRKSEAHRIRLLGVIEKIGKPLEANEFFDLMDLSRRSTRPVQARIVQLMLELNKAPSPNDATKTPAATTIGDGTDINEY